MADSFIVADAGGTSTEWRVVLGGEVHEYETIGFNAYTHDLDDLKTSIRQMLGLEFSHIPVFIYAAGVDTEEQKRVVAGSLSEIFKNDLLVENDLVGVARAIFGKSEGNACILGTGSNACYYNGKKVNRVSASLGYVLGDEGSGAYLGKKLMMGVFRKHFSAELIKAFQREYNLTSYDVIQHIYHRPRPNNYLSSFAKFILQHKSHPEIYGMIKKSFEDFFEAFFRDMEDTTVPFGFSGSIAWYFSEILTEVASERGHCIQKIIQSPIAALVHYHQNEV